MFRLSLYWIAVLASVGGLLVGFDSGVITGAEITLRRDFALNLATEGLVVGSVLIGSVLGAAIGGKLSDAIGRTWTICVLAVTVILGAVLTACSWNVGLVIAFRMLTGLGLGMAILVVSMYLTELAPPSKRGMLVTWNQLALSIGILVAYALDLLEIHLHLGWRLLFGMECLPALVLAVSSRLFLPESPRWLAKKGRWQQVEQVLGQIAGAEKERELRAIHRTLKAQQNASVREFFTTGLRLALITGIGLALIQQLSGVTAITGYAPTLFKGAGFSSLTGDILAALAIAVVAALARVVSIFLLDRVGRRPLLLSSLAGTALMLVGLGILFAIHPAHEALFLLLALLVYIFTYGVGLGPLYSLLSAEIFPTALRGTGDSISTVVNWGTTALVSLTFLSLTTLISKQGTFWLYALLTVVGFVFCWKLVPETKGKSLEHIEEYWKNGQHWP